MAAAVAIADGLCEEVGLGFYAETDPVCTEAAITALGLDARTVALLRAEAVELAQRVT
jgi:hypothetical protein